MCLTASFKKFYHVSGYNLKFGFSANSQNVTVKYSELESKLYIVHKTQFPETSKKYLENFGVTI